jgi:ABC-type uncharacterized transport system YnjBCD ATPase subunit
VEITFHDFQKQQSWLMAKRSRKKTNKKKNPAAVALSKLGASKGGKARAKKLSAADRSRIAKLAVETRWAKYYGEK